MNTLIVMNPSQLTMLILMANSESGHALENVKKARALHQRIRRDLIVWAKANLITLEFDERAGRHTKGRHYRVALNGTDNDADRLDLLNRFDAKMTQLVQSHT